jgi:two-component system NarL family sensor kinase
MEPSIRYSHSLKDSSSIMEAIQEVSRTYNEFPDSAYTLLDRVYKSSVAMRNTYGSGMAMLYKGIIETNRNHLDQAKQSLDKALKDLEQSNPGKKELHLVYTNLGNLSFLRGNYEEALQLQYKAIRTGEQFPGTDVNYLYANVAAILIHTGRNTESIKQYVEKARLSALRKNDVRTLSKIYNNIALSFSVEKKWDSSIVYFRKALKIADINRMFPMQHLALSNIGIIYLEQGKTDSAMLYLQQARAMDTAAVALSRERARGALGVAYLQLNQPQRARPLLEEQYQLAAQRNNKQDLRESYYNLSRLYGAEGDYRKGYTNAWNYIALNDSIAGNEVVNNVNKIEAKYRVAEGEKQLLSNKLKLSEQEKALQARNKWLLLIVVTGLLLIPIVLLVWRNYQHKKTLLSEQVRSMKRDQAIKGLQATIEGEENERSRIAKELHDGVGALISAAKMNLGVLENKVQQTESGDIYHSTLQLLDEIGNELRITAHNMMPVAIMDRDLAAAIQHFCSYTGKAKRLPIEVQAYGNFASLPDAMQLTAYRIVQELINNVVKHAQAGMVLVQLVLQDTLLSITVEDNGKGFDYSDDSHFDGVGLKSIRDRVKSTSGTMSVSSRPGKGTSVYIEWEVHSEI